MQAHILARPDKKNLGLVSLAWPFCQTKIRRILWLVSVDVVWLLSSCLRFSWWREKESGESRKWLLLEMKLIDWPKYSWCSAKESSVLNKRSDDAQRKQSIYSQISLNCYVSGGNNTGQIHSNHSCFTWVSWNFLSVAFLSLWIHLENHHKNGRFRKRYLFFRWDSVSFWGLMRVSESFIP